MGGGTGGGCNFCGEFSSLASLMDVNGELKALDGAVFGVRQKLPLPPAPSELTMELFSLENKNCCCFTIFLHKG